MSLLATVAMLAAAAPASAAQDGRWQELKVLSHGRSVQATLGSYCHTTREPDGTATSVCGDAGYPLRTRGSVPVHGRGNLTLEFGAAAAQVTVRLVDPSGPRRPSAPLTVRRLDAAGLRWRAKLPRRTASRPAADVFVRFAEGGDANWWARTRPHRHR